MNKKTIYNIFLALTLSFTQIATNDSPIALLVKPSKVTPIVEGTEMKDLLLKVRFRDQAVKFDVPDILVKKNKATAFKVDSFNTIKGSPLIIELHNKEHYDGKNPIASESIIVEEKKQVRHKLNLGPVKVSVRTQVKDYFEDIIKVIDNNDINKLKSYLSNKNYLKIPSQKKYEALKYAYELKANDEIINLLIKQFNENLIHQSAINNNEEIIRLLLEKGVDINSQNNNKDTPLIIAVKQNNPKIVELLLNAGADPNIYNNQGDNALSVASWLKNKKIFNILLNSELTTKETINYILAQSASEGQTSIIKLILRLPKDKFDINYQPSMASGEKDFTPLENAATYAHKEISKLLIEHGANTSLSNSYKNRGFATRGDRSTTRNIIEYLINIEQNIKENQPIDRRLLSRLPGEDLQWVISKAIKNSIIEELLPPNYKTLVNIYKKLLGGNISDKEIINIINHKSDLIPQELTTQEQEAYNNLSNNLEKILYLHKVGSLESYSKEKTKLSDLLERQNVIPIALASKIVLEY